jgi:uncharacterized protein YjbI with pentapeptide repeats
MVTQSLTIDDLLELLRGGEEGITQWNRLRDEGLVIPSLEGVDLLNARLIGANLSQVNLEGATLRGADLRAANLQGTTLRGADLYGAWFENANLRDADLSGANMYRATFVGADITYTEFGGIMNAVFDSEQYTFIVGWMELHIMKK